MSQLSLPLTISWKRLLSLVNTPRSNDLYVVGVRWTDAAHHDDGEDARTIECLTVGHVSKMTTKAISVSGDVDDEGTFRYTLTVPRKMTGRIILFGVIPPVTRKPEEAQGGE